MTDELSTIREFAILKRMEAIKDETGDQCDSLIATRQLRVSPEIYEEGTHSCAAVEVDLFIYIIDNHPDAHRHTHP